MDGWHCVDRTLPPLDTLVEAECGRSSRFVVHRKDHAHSDVMRSVTISEAFRRAASLSPAAINSR